MDLLSSLFCSYWLFDLTLAVYILVIYAILGTDCKEALSRKPTESNSSSFSTILHHLIVVKWFCMQINLFNHATNHKYFFILENCKLDCCPWCFEAKPACPFAIVQVSSWDH